MINDALTADPSLGSLHLGALVGSGTTALDTTAANAAKYSADQTGIAASGGTDPNAINLTMKVGSAQSFMPPEGFRQQQATDLQARTSSPAPQPPPVAPGSAPSASSPGAPPSTPAAPISSPAGQQGPPTPPPNPFLASIPKPTGNAVTDYEARSTSAMPTSAENLTAQTTENDSRRSAQAQRDVAAMHIKAQKDMEAMRQGAAPAMFGATPSGQGGSASLADASPIVKALINRDYDPMLMRRWKPEQQAAIMAEVQKYDPGFNMNDYPTQAATKKDFNSGKSAAAVRSINQLIGHLNTLNTYGDKLNNSRFPMWNAVANTVERQAGNEGLQESMGQYDRAAHAVGNELETMLRGSSVSGEKEREAVQSAFSHNTTPADRKGAINAALDLMASRLRELDDQYTKGVGRQRDFSILNPASRSILQKFGVSADSLDAPGVGGGAAPQTQPTGQPKVGDKKTFPNGRVGVWDGVGWMAQ